MKLGPKKLGYVQLFIFSPSNAHVILSIVGGFSVVTIFFTYYIIRI